MNTQLNSNAGSSCSATSCSASPEAVQYADYILNHYSRDSHADKLSLARDLEWHGWKKSSLARLPWWRKDALGWPIEIFKSKPVKSAIRIICQNIRKVICKPNAIGEATPPEPR
jgi:hypothetical protein